MQLDGDGGGGGAATARCGHRHNNSDHHATPRLRRQASVGASPSRGASYRLFPAVESIGTPHPTPPIHSASASATPSATPSTAASTSASTSGSGGLRRTASDRRTPLLANLECVSPEERERVLAKKAAQLAASRQLHSNTPRPVRNKASSIDLRPMSTLRELELDSPTVPFGLLHGGRSIVKTKGDESWHNRSSSAPGEYVSALQTSPVDDILDVAIGLSVRPPFYANGRAASSAQMVCGLGVTMPPSASDPSTPLAASRKLRSKPDLRIRTDNHRPPHLPGVEHPPDRPPPPPPKSPRMHSGKASTHSRTSSKRSNSSKRSLSSTRMSTRPNSPVAVAQSMAYTLAKPTFVVHHGSHSRDASNSSSENLASSALEAYKTEKTERGRTKQAVTRKAVAAPGASNAAVVVPASNFSVPADGTSRSVCEKDGETTPKASMHSAVESEKSAPPPLPDSLRTGIDCSSESAPPIPRKDSIYVAKAKPASTSQLAPPKQKDVPLESPNLFRPSMYQKLPGPEPPKTDVGRSKPSKKSAPSSQPNPPASPRLFRPSLYTSLTGPESADRGAERNAATGTQPPPLPSDPTKSSEKHKAAKEARPARHISPREVTERCGATLEPRSGDFFIDRPTPELPFRSATPEPLSTADEDPWETLENLAKQTEGLHKRYASLRSERQKLSSSMTASLKEPQAGAEYIKALLDQHLALLAINSSMDICFAKLKSLECRKEAAMTAITSTYSRKRLAHKKLIKVQPAISQSSANSSNSESSPLLIQGVMAQVPPTIKRKDSALTGQEDHSAHTRSTDAGLDDDSEESERRKTVIGPSPSDVQPDVKATVEPEQLPSIVPSKTAENRETPSVETSTPSMGLHPTQPPLALVETNSDIVPRPLFSPPAYISKLSKLALAISPGHLPPPSPAPAVPLPTPPASSTLRSRTPSPIKFGKQTNASIDQTISAARLGTDMIISPISPESLSEVDTDAEFSLRCRTESSSGRSSANGEPCTPATDREVSPLSPHGQKTKKTPGQVYSIGAAHFEILEMYHRDTVVGSPRPDGE